MKQKLLAAGGMAAVLVLMSLPYGVAMTFGPGPGITMVKYYSYFSLMPIGYENYLPMLTALLTIAALVLTLVGLKKTTTMAPRVCLGLAIMNTLVSWAVFQAFNWVGLIVLVMHIAAFLLLLLCREK